MAKKKTSDSDGNVPARARSRATPRRAASTTSAPRQRAKVTQTTADVFDTAADMKTVQAGIARSYDPSYDEIAEAAYHRYLRRGAQHGGDFDDWVEAERELRSRQTR